MFSCLFTITIISAGGKRMAALTCGWCVRAQPLHSLANLVLSAGRWAMTRLYCRALIVPKVPTLCIQRFMVQDVSCLGRPPRERFTGKQGFEFQSLLLTGVNGRALSEEK